MTDGAEKPVWKTGWLWGILAGFVIVGSVGAATFLYGTLDAVAGEPIGLGFMALGAVATLLAFLFTLGILYRVDRYRGATGRRVELFE